MTATAPAPTVAPHAAPDGALDALTGAVRDAITRRIQSPRQIAVYLAGELARAGHQIGAEQQPVPPAAAAPAPVATWGGWVCGRPDCTLGCQPDRTTPERHATSSRKASS